MRSGAKLASPRRFSQSAVWSRIVARHVSSLSAVVRQVESHRGVTEQRGSHREGVTRRPSSLWWLGRHSGSPGRSPLDQRISGGTGGAEDIAAQLGHTDGGVLVQRLHGHPSTELARKRAHEAYRRPIVLSLTPAKDLNNG